jgi:anthranilate/para-aminobenzoate synthase component I
MSEELTIDVKTVENPGIDPATAYAKLRSYTPGRGSFLFASHDHGSEDGRYSVVGYRVRQIQMYPPGVNAVEVQSKLCEERDAPESFAQALVEGRFGYLAACCVNAHHKLGNYEDEAASGHVNLGATVIVFDHIDNTMTVAGPAKGTLVERCLWELDNGPDIADLPAPDPTGVPLALTTLIPESALMAKAARGKPFLGDELDSLVIAQTFMSASGKSDPFDAYRALCAMSDAPLSYYLDFGELPGAPNTKLAGTGSEMFHRRRRGDEPKSVLDSWLQAFPHASHVGAPPLLATKLLLRVEDNSRGLWGGAVGYMCPGGESAFMRADQLITVQGGMYYVTAGGELGPDTDPASVHPQAREASAPCLAAVRAAQSAAAK